MISELDDADVPFEVWFESLIRGGCVDEVFIRKPELRIHHILTCAAGSLESKLAKTSHVYITGIIRRNYIKCYNHHTWLQELQELINPET